VEPHGTPIPSVPPSTAALKSSDEVTSISDGVPCPSRVSSPGKGAHVLFAWRLTPLLTGVTLRFGLKSTSNVPLPPAGTLRLEAPASGMKVVSSEEPPSASVSVTVAGALPEFRTSIPCDAVSVYGTCPQFWSI